MLIPQRPLLASTSFGRALEAPRVAAALAQGLRAGGRPDAEVCTLAGQEHPGALVEELLARADFDRRMLAARAVIVAAARLERAALRGSLAFEIATRARQAGVPAFAVTAENGLDAFDARMLDLQAVLEAGTARALGAAGRTLARMMG